MPPIFDLAGIMGNPKSLKFFENIAIQYLGKAKKFQNNIINGLGELNERKKAWALSAPPPTKDRVNLNTFLAKKKTFLF